MIFPKRAVRFIKVTHTANYYIFIYRPEKNKKPRMRPRCKKCLNDFKAEVSSLNKFTLYRRRMHFQRFKLVLADEKIELT